MKPWPRLLVPAMMLAACLAGCTRNVQKLDLTDAGIKTRIETQLRSQPDLNLRYVTVNVDAGVVTVSGIVESARERDAIAHIARRTKGASQVLVNLLVSE